MSRYLRQRYKSEDLVSIGFVIVEANKAVHPDAESIRWKCVRCGDWVSNLHRNGWDECTQCFIQSHKLGREKLPEKVH